MNSDITEEHAKSMKTFLSVCSYLINFFLYKALFIFFPWHLTRLSIVRSFIKNTCNFFYIFFTLKDRQILQHIAYSKKIINLDR